ncbi:MAG: hypothetical protein NT067_02880 [Candidatus Diapherotrites archaeon]|nr:hypothetical protein [Candidatus Diapherotrites archaeon]
MTAPAGKKAKKWIPINKRKKGIPGTALRRRLGTRTYTARPLPEGVRKITTNLVVLLNMGPGRLFEKDRRADAEKRQALQWAVKRGIYDDAMKIKNGLKTDEQKGKFVRDTIFRLARLPEKQRTAVFAAIAPLTPERSFLRKEFNHLMLTADPERIIASRKEEAGKKAAGRRPTTW